MASTIGTAYINIAPNMSGIQGKIAGGLKGSGSQFADQFGNEINGRSGVIIGAVAGIVASVTNKAMQLISGSIGDAVSRVDTLNNAPKVLQNLGYSASDSSKSIKTLADGIKGLPTRLDAASTALTQIASASGYGIGKATDLTLAFNNMALAGGKGPQAAADALQQFTQGLGKGKLQMQDFQTLQSVMPAQLNQLAKTLLGPAANTQTLEAALSSGKISMDQFSDGIISLNQKGGPGFASFKQQAKDATGGIGTSFTNMQAAIVRGIAKIITSFGSANISDSVAKIGKAFETALDKVAGFVTFVVQHKDIFLPIAIGVAAFAAAVTIGVTAMKIARATMDAWKAAVGLWSAITKIATGVQAAFNLVMDANPVVLIALAIAGLVAGLIYFFTQTKLGKKIFEDILGVVKDVFNWVAGHWPLLLDIFLGPFGFLIGLIIKNFGAIVGFFQGVWDAIGGAISAFIGWIADHWRLIIAIVLGPLGLLIDFVTAYWSQIVGAISAAIGFVWNIITSVFGAIAGFMGAVFGPPINAIVGVFSWLGGIVGSIVGGIWNGITSAFGAVTGFLGGVGSKIIGLFKGAGSWLYDTGKDIITGLINGAESLLSKIGEMFLNVIPGWIKTPFKKALGIHSPSTVFAEFGGNITDGLVNGITAQADSVKAAVGTLSDSAVAGMTNNPIAAQFATQATTASPAANSAIAGPSGAGQGADGPAVVQNNSIYNQVDLNAVTRELAWQIRR